MNPLEGTSTKPQIKAGFNILSQLCYGCTLLSIQKLCIISANSSSDPMFSSSISNTGFAAGHLQQALLEQRGGYMAMAPATPQPQDHIPLFGSPDPEVSKTQHGSISRGFFQKLINPSNI